MHGFRPVPKVLEEDEPLPRSLFFPGALHSTAPPPTNLPYLEDTFRAQRSLGCFLLQPSSSPGRRSPDWVHVWPQSLSFFVSKLQIITSTICLGHFHTHYLSSSRHPGKRVARPLEGTWALTSGAFPQAAGPAEQVLGKAGSITRILSRCER